MKIYLASFIIVCCLLSCDYTVCQNHNKVLESHDPKSKEYRHELANQVQQRNFRKIDYSINGYAEISSIPYLVVNISGEDLCARGYLNIANADKLQQFKKVKGLSYSGAGLAGLKFHIDSAGGNYNFIFDDVDWIID